MRRRAAGLFTRGVAMGTADVIPGVSGGTMALITGIYDELVATVAGIDRHLVTALLRGRFVEVLERANAGFLVPLPYNYYKLRRLGHSCHSSAKAPA